MSAVHTSAPTEPDMVGTDAAAPEQGDLVLQIAGVLISAAEVRVKLVGEDKHPVPVLCMDVRPLSGLKRTIHAEQIYSEATRKVAELKAATLKRGVHVTFTTTLTGMRITFPNVKAAAPTYPSDPAT